MLTLAFDTTSSALSIALLSDQKILTKNTIHESGKQSELLIPEIEKILREQKIWYQDLDLIATSHGPGSFTGTRIGLTAARTIRLATNLPLVLVNSCEAAAFKHRERFGEIVVLLDAGMNEFFGAKFFAENRKLTEVLEPQLVRSEDLSAFLPKEKFFLCGSGKKLINMPNLIQETELQDLSSPRRLDPRLRWDDNGKIVEEKDEIEADVIGLLALEKFRAGEISGDLDPIYLRAPRVTERKK